MVTPLLEARRSTSSGDFILFLKRTMAARNYKIRPFRTVYNNTELGYRSLQGKRKCKKKKKKEKKSVIQIFSYLNLSMERGTMGQGGTLLTQSSTAKDPFRHSYIALDTRRCEKEKVCAKASPL